MGGAMLRRWVETTKFDFTVIDPQAQELPSSVHHTTLEALDQRRFDAIIVGIKPQLIDEVLPDYSSYLKAEGWVFSMAAGASCARIEASLRCPKVVRIMPNLPALIGQSMSGLFAHSQVSADEKNSAETLARSIGRYLWVKDEDTLDRVTAIAGSGPGYVFEIMRSYVLAAQSLGFSEAQARELVLQTVQASASMAQQSELSLEALRNSVTSKNGTTEAGLAQLRAEQTLEELLKKCTRAAYARAVELR